MLKRLYSFDLLSKDSGIVMTGKNQLHTQYPLKLVYKTKNTFVVIVVTWHVVVIWVDKLVAECIHLQK